MSFKRPSQVPRWGWLNTAVLVQPSSGYAGAGYTVRQQPAAQHLNWQFNALGGWVDFLRGPDVEKWTRSAWAASFNAPAKIPFDVDRDTSDAGQTNAAFRYAAVGQNSTPKARIHASQRGNAWVERTNLPDSADVTGPFALKALFGVWYLGCLSSLGAALIYYGDTDDGTARGPMGANGNAWTIATMPGSPTEVKAFAQLSSGDPVVAACATNAIYSSDSGATWGDCTFGGTPSGNGRDVVTTATKYVWVSQDGEVQVSGDGITFAVATTLAAGAGTWQLCAGDGAEVVAYRLGQSSEVDLYRSTDDGTSWTAVTQTSGAAPKYITRLAYAEGVWCATSSRSPFLWVSNDLVSWRALNPPVDTSASPAALYNVRYDGGSWVAVGNGFALACGRAADPAGGLYVASDAPATLSDAGSWRGRLLSTTAPTNGQVMVWNSTSSRWEPGSAAGSSPTTTRGDLIRRGASADERFAAKAINTFVGGDGTDVGVRTVAQVRTSLGLDRREPAGSPAPLLWWKCDETDVTTSTVANSGSTGSSAGTITAGTAGARGPWGEPGVQLRGSGYIRAPVDVVRPTSAITLALWWRQPALDDARLFWRPYGGTWTAPYVAVSLFVDSGGVPSGSVSVSGTEHVAAASSLVARAGEWHHSALTYDGTTLKVYLDGVLVASASVSGSIDYGAAPTLTRWHVGGNAFAVADNLTGETADVRIYDAAQAAAWVARTFKRGRGSYDGT